MEELEKDASHMILKEFGIKKEIKQKRTTLLMPHRPINRILYLTISVFSFVIFLAAWFLITDLKFVDPLFLPDPLEVIKSGYEMFTQGRFLNDTLSTLSRVFIGFGLAVIVGVPIGILVGTYKIFEAFLEPLTSFIRYLPVSAFVPLFILWIGVGEIEKQAVIFAGSVFSLIIMVAVNVRNVKKELLEAAYTLGSTNIGVIRRVIIPASLPGIINDIRLVLGWAWTYIIVAELVAASSGIGHVIIQAQRMIQTSTILFAIIVIGFMGLASDVLLKWVSKKLFVWKYGR